MSINNIEYVCSMYNTMTCIFHIIIIIIKDIITTTTNIYLLLL